MNPSHKKVISNPVTTLALQEDDMERDSRLFPPSPVVNKLSSNDNQSKYDKYGNVKSDHRYNNVERMHNQVSAALRCLLAEAVQREEESHDAFTSETFKKAMSKLEAVYNQYRNINPASQKSLSEVFIYFKQCWKETAAKCKQSVDLKKEGL